MKPDLRVKIFADGADLSEMLRIYEQGLACGFTTNPTLMRKAGVTDYGAFAREVLALLPDVPISLEVLADDFETMYRQAMTLHSWGERVYVKVPITNSRGDSSLPLLERLVAEGVKVNTTAVLTLGQVRALAGTLRPEVPSIVSIFAGRIADTGRDPVPIMKEAVRLLEPCGAEVLWASPREVLNIYQAEECGCHIVTVTPDLLAKLSMRGMDLEALSRETVRMFHHDALRAGYEI
ncbi:MAG TPA: transaldolase [Candidatus Nitrosotenuis sp.]|nr:transaldolase [Candidatus Nitrosotenuis sp.]